MFRREVELLRAEVEAGKDEVTRRSEAEILQLTQDLASLQVGKHKPILCWYNNVGLACQVEVAAAGLERAAAEEEEEALLLRLEARAAMDRVFPAPYRPAGRKRIIKKRREEL